ncbi:uncharacterized protein LOC111039050 [Myzus persicae]|uniref:uncharacterized protein LOC111039050 n=1 Tax=Myzus persicae TaxID=13164 RepID=UPI000B932B92|nr:uncharacterized protein LOC111039050 [Myzus persicae]
MDEHESHVDNNDTSRKFAMPFSMLKLAYYRCSPEERELYDTKAHGVRVDLKACCNYLMAPGDRLREIKPDANKLDVCSEASSFGHLDCLRQAHVAGIPWNWRSVELACRYGHLDCLTYLHTNGCDTGGNVSALSAASAGQISTLEYALNNGFPHPRNLCTEVSRHGHLELLRYLRSSGFPCDETTTAAAAEHNQLELLKFLRSENCPWNESTCMLAALNGHLEVLRYAHENGCAWDQSTCHSAARNGHIECLKYAHINGCQWNMFTPVAAAINNQKDCFIYAVLNGCPCLPSLTWDDLMSHLHNHNADDQ